MHSFRIYSVVIRFSTPVLLPGYSTTCWFQQKKSGLYSLSRFVWFGGPLGFIVFQSKTGMPWALQYPNMDVEGQGGGGHTWHAVFCAPRSLDVFGSWWQILLDVFLMCLSFSPFLRAVLRYTCQGIHDTLILWFSHVCVCVPSFLHARKRVLKNGGMTPNPHNML